MGRKRKDRGTDAPPTTDISHVDSPTPHTTKAPCLETSEPTERAHHTGTTDGLYCGDSRRDAAHEPVVVLSSGDVVAIDHGPRHLWTRLTEELKEQIFDLYRGGMSLTAIAREAGFPTSTTIYRHMEEDDEFRRKLAAIRTTRAERYEDDAQEAAMRATPETASSERLRFDVAKWRASVNNPAVYGNKTQVTGDASQPIAFTVVTGVPHRDDEKPIELNADGTVKR